MSGALFHNPKGICQIYTLWGDQTGPLVSQLDLDQKGVVQNDTLGGKQTEYPNQSLGSISRFPSWSDRGAA